MNALRKNQSNMNVSQTLSLFPGRQGTQPSQFERGAASDKASSTDAAFDQAITASYTFM
jgi:hypothetical protein